MSMTPIIAPGGSSGEVPTERLQEALQAGGKPGVWMKAPDGSIGIIPRERVQEALQAGGKAFGSRAALEQDAALGPQREAPGFGEAVLGKTPAGVQPGEDYGPPLIGGPAEPIVTAVQKYGRPLARMGLAVPGEIVRSVAGGLYDIGKAAVVPPQTTWEKAALALGPGGLLAKRLIVDPAREEIEQARQAGERGESGRVLLHSAAAGLPVVGPFAASKIERALEGDPFAGAEMLGEAEAFKGIGKATAKLPGRIGERGERLRTEPSVARENIGRAFQENLAAVVRQGKAKVGELVDNLTENIDDPSVNPVPAIDGRAALAEAERGFEGYTNEFTDLGQKVPSRIRKAVEAVRDAPEGRLSFEQAKHMRTAYGEMIETSKDPSVKAALTVGRRALTDAMRDAASRQGLEADFDEYNHLNTSLEDLREQFIGPVTGAATGEQAVNAVGGGREGAVRSAIDALKPYGLDGELAETVLNLSKRPGAGRFGTMWAARHLGGSLARMAGLPFGAGYIATGVAEAKLPRAGAGTDIRQPGYLRGERIVQQRLPHPPRPVTEPRIIPPAGGGGSVPPPGGGAGGGGAGPAGALPVVRPPVEEPPRGVLTFDPTTGEARFISQLEAEAQSTEPTGVLTFDPTTGEARFISQLEAEAQSTEPTAEPEVMPPEAGEAIIRAPGSRYQGVQKAAAETGALNRWVNGLRKGVAPPEREVAIIERLTGLDLTDRRSWPQAVKILKAMQSEEPTVRPPAEGVAGALREPLGGEIPTGPLAAPRAESEPTVQPPTVPNVGKGQIRVSDRARRGHDRKFSKPRGRK